ncbi:MAG: hypothetical protein ACJA2Q_002651 [Pseudohongiellaceae bacterium]|jgi:hypothetical protein
MMVVPYRPARRVILGLLLVVGVGASAAGGFLYSYYVTIESQQGELASREELSEGLQSSELENSDLRRQIAILDRSSVMDQRATEEVQFTIVTLRERVAQLEQDIVYYRQVVSDETGETGLVISQLDIATTSTAGVYSYKLVLRQLDADGDSYLIGFVNINLVGSQGEVQMIFPLREVSQEQDLLDIRLRFKYFQNIEGSLTLPEGFVPERVQIAAVSTEPVEKDINQDFSWVVEGE